MAKLKGKVKTMTRVNREDLIRAVETEARACKVIESAWISPEADAFFMMGSPSRSADLFFEASKAIVAVQSRFENGFEVEGRTIPAVHDVSGWKRVFAR